jgi:uncharacterized membrane protein YeiB
VTASTSRRAATATTARLPGPDVVRAVALIGVVAMNYHGYLILRGSGRPGTGWWEELFDPWTGPLSTRFAATFVLVAGVSVTLMTTGTVARRRAAPTDEDARRAVTEMRWRLARRGTFLYVGGLLLDEVWRGTIIPYYGVMFALAALMFTWRSRWIVLTGVGAALAAAGLRWWRFERELDGESTSWLTRPEDGSLRDHLFGITVNGTHPLLPWLAFLCAGIVLGRVLRTTWWRPATIAAGVTLVSLAALAATLPTTDTGRILASLRPLDRSLVYVASALGTALIAYAAVDWLATRHPAATDPLRRAGQMSLTLYLAHVAVFLLVVDALEWVEPAGVGTALAFALAFWTVGIALAVEWHRRFGMGPAERCYRAFGC